MGVKRALPLQAIPDRLLLPGAPDTHLQLLRPQLRLPDACCVPDTCRIHSSSRPRIHLRRHHRTPPAAGLI